MTETIMILGTGGNCLDILDAISALNHTSHQYDMIGFLDDNPNTWGTAISGYPVHGALSRASHFPQARFVDGIGSTRSYLKKTSIIAAAGILPDQFATVVHPSTVTSTQATIGMGAVILANTTVCANASVGRHAMILPNCVISHDCQIADDAILASGVVLCGKVTLEPNCYIGAGSVILEGLTIGTGSLVGAGSVVTKNVPPHTIVYGNPARLQPVNTINAQSK